MKKDEDRRADRFDQRITSNVDKQSLDLFRQRLQAAGYQGQLNDDVANRLVYATDNSVYQVPPAAVAIPACTEDIAVLAAVNSGLPRPHPLVARGGGTGTNGQSLTNGIAVDTKRHCNQILAIDADRREAVVEPGVVLDQLNEALSPFDLFFAPHVSTSSRATVGGMVATDAAGKGSLIHGRTNDHVVSIDAVLADGTQVCFTSTPGPSLRARTEEQTSTNRVSELVDALEVALEEIDASSLPAIERGFTGYNLGDASTGEGTDVTKLLCGSEGTLALTTAITVRLTPLSSFTRLVVVGFDSFTDAITEANRLKQTNPSAIECLDERTIELARTSPSWVALENSFEDSARPPKALLLLEYNDQDAVEDLLSSVAQHPKMPYSVASDPQVIADIWKIRKDAVGLLGQQVDGQRAVPFVEDCAVPPHKMPAFIADFRAILDSHQLTYGMFGHADVGCVHVRPALDLYRDEHQQLLRTVSDEVADLVSKYGGVLWGEHGRGFRGEYVDVTPDLYHRMRQVKTAFDPDNILNPHKLYAPLAVNASESSDAAETIVKIDRVPLRATKDRTVELATRDDFDSAFACNGNGICHHWGGTETMCPSYKVTSDPLLSPKGRADLLRAWAADPDNEELQDSLTSSLNACLSCSACTGRCPVSVDIPELKSKFLSRHPDNGGVKRLRHPVLSKFESLLPTLRRLGPLGVAGQRLCNPLLERTLGLSDLPQMRPIDRDRFTSMNVPIMAKPQVPAGVTVVVLPDAFSFFFEPRVLETTAFVLQAVGETPAIGPFVPSGKYDHVKGFRSRFRTATQKQRSLVETLQTQDVDLVVAEPAVQMLYGHEYRLMDPDFPSESVLSLPAYLKPRMRLVDRTELPTTEARVSFFAHCTEASMKPEYARLYSEIFEHVGLRMETTTTTCCGMAGIFGHERENQDMSKGLFEQYWGDKLRQTDAEYRCAPGYSCRSQASRFGVHGLKHPVEALAKHLGFPETV